MMLTTGRSKLWSRPAPSCERRVRDSGPGGVTVAFMTETAPAGWYDDPYNPGTQLRWWDGLAWTEHIDVTVEPAPTGSFADDGPHSELPSSDSAASDYAGATPPATWSTEGDQPFGHDPGYAADPSAGTDPFATLGAGRATVAWQHHEQDTGALTLPDQHDLVSADEHKPDRKRKLKIAGGVAAALLLVGAVAGSGTKSDSAPAQQASVDRNTFKDPAGFYTLTPAGEWADLATNAAASSWTVGEGVTLVVAGSAVTPGTTLDAQRSAVLAPISARAGYKVIAQTTLPLAGGLVASLTLYSEGKNSETKGMVLVAVSGEKAVSASMSAPAAAFDKAWVGTQSALLTLRIAVTAAN